MNSLIEKVARIMAAQVSLMPFNDLSPSTRDTYRRNAAPIIAEVLEHFSDLMNVTKSMYEAHTEIEYPDGTGSYYVFALEFAAAMKAAKEELSSDIKPKSTHPG